MVPALSSPMAGLSSSLKAALQLPTETIFPVSGRGGQQAETGCWRPPENVTAEMIAEAKKSLPMIEHQLRPAAKETVSKWLANLGLLCAGQMPANDAKMKVAAYLPHIAQPECSFTAESLKAAGQKFSWFPSFAEVNAFLDEQCVDIRIVRQRLIDMAKATPPQPRMDGWAALTPEQKAQHEAMMAQVRANFSRMADPQVCP